MGTRALLLTSCCIALLTSNSNAQLNNATSTRTVERAKVSHVLEPFSSSTGQTAQRRSAATARQAASGQTGSSPLLGMTFDSGGDGSPVPDSMIAAGPKYLMGVTGSLTYRIFDKSGNRIANLTTRDFYSSFDDWNCCTDARVIFDSFHSRFIVAAFEVRKDTPSHLYVAVSETDDPTGNWHKYQLEYGDNSTFPDFPSLGVSRNSLYISTDQAPVPQSGSTYSSNWVSVFSMDELLSGASTLSIVKFKDIQKPDGSAVYQIQPALSYEDSPYEYMVQADWLAKYILLYSINTTGTPNLSADAIPMPSCGVPSPTTQKGTAVRINVTAMVLSAVYRLGSLWFTQECADDYAFAPPFVRWYEIDPVAKKIKQTGTVSGVGAAYFGALAVLPNGDVDMVYSTSSADSYASAGYAHRSASDAPGTMPIQGVYWNGLQPYTFNNGWGDLSGASPDPDGKSVWGIAEVADDPALSNAWTTAVAQIFSGGATAAPDFTVSGSAASVAVDAGKSATMQVNVQGQNGFNGPVSFSFSGVPSGVLVTANPTSLTGSGTSTLTFTAPAGVASSNSTLTITATSGALSHSVSVGLVVNGAAPATPSFTLASSASQLAINPGSSGSVTLTVAAQNGFSRAVAFAISGLPTGATATFNPAQVNGAGTSNLTIAVPATAAASTTTVTVTATSGTLSQSVQLAMAISGGVPAAADFSISAAPTAASTTAGGSASYAISIATQNGFNQPISFSCSGLPTGYTCGFSPNPLTPTGSGDTATMRVSVPATAAGLQSVPRINRLMWAGLFAFGIAFVVIGGRNDRRFAARGLLFVCIVSIALFVNACGGTASSSGPSGSGNNGGGTPTPGGGTSGGSGSGSGGSGSGGSGGPGTPTPQTYKITINAASGSLQHTTTVDLTVQ